MRISSVFDADQNFTGPENLLCSTDLLKMRCTTKVLANLCARSSFLLQHAFIMSDLDTGRKCWVQFPSRQAVLTGAEHNTFAQAPPSIHMSLGPHKIGLGISQCMTNDLCVLLFRSRYLLFVVLHRDHKGWEDLAKEKKDTSILVDVN